MAAATRAAEKPQIVLEKDYALSYLLDAIVGVPRLRASLVFKGGTCLRKAYFAGYRFSEDLDFTSHSPWTCDELLAAFGDAINHMKARLDAYGPFEVLLNEETYGAPHPRGQCAFRVRVQYPWMRSPACSLKIEVSAQEPLLAGAVERALIHEFPGESLAVTLPSYSLEEIAAEKLRAFLQSRQHLRDRGWLRNRPRDLYDLWYLDRQHEVPVEWSAVGPLLSKKAAAYGLTFDGSDDFLDEQVLRGIERDWQGQLARFVTDLPSFDECADVLRRLVGTILA